MDDICIKYFQKSRIFLYPILGIPRKSSVRPIETFISWKGNYCVSDNKLLCTYYTREDPEFEAFEKKYLLDNSMFVRCHTISEDINLYVFDFSEYSESFKYFTEGSYSKMNKKYKKSLVEYYEEGSKTWEYLLSYLYPHNWYDRYSEFLLVKPDVLEEARELCDKPDFIKENFEISEKSPKIVKINV